MRHAKILAALATMTMMLTPAIAQDAAVPSGWQTWTWEGTCFAVIFPNNPGVAELQSERAYLAIKHVPAEQTFGSVSFVSGIADLTGYSAKADVDGKVFDLLLYQEAGFVKTGPREDELLASMLAGSEVSVTWTGKTGLVNQTYSLAGLSQAKRTIDTACAAPAAATP